MKHKIWIAQQPSTFFLHVIKLPCNVNVLSRALQRKPSTIMVLKLGPFIKP